MNIRKVRMHQAEVLKKAGYSQKEIAEQLGVSDRMVRYYLATAEKKLPPVKTKLIDPFRDYITTVLQETPHFNLEVLKKEIRKQGYTGGITTLRVFAKSIRDSIVKQAIIRFETTPGKQAQVDWKEAGIWEIDGINRKVYAFVMLMGYSRRAYVQFTTDMKSPTLLACHLDAFRYFDGISQEILYDNMKTAWLNRSGVWEVNPSLLELAATCGFTPKRCKVRRPQTKGKVERFIGYLGNHFLPMARNRTIMALEDLNREVNVWLEEIDAEQIRSFCESRNSRFEHEKSFLSPFILSAAPDIRAANSVMVSREGTIRFETNVYSVPAQYLGVPLTVKYHPIQRVAELYAGKTSIRTFPLLPAGSKSTIILDSDRKDLVELWKRQNHMKETSCEHATITHQVEVQTRSPAWYESLYTELAV